MFKYLATVSVILFGVKVFADMPVKDLEIKVLWITQMGPKSNQKCFKEIEKKTQTHRGEGKVKMEAEIRQVNQENKEC